MNTLPLLDQSQCAAVREHLLLQCAALGATVTRLTGETVTQPKLTGDELQDVEALRAHAATLQAKLDVLPAKPATGQSAAANPQPQSPASRIAALEEQCLFYENALNVVQGRPSAVPKRPPQIANLVAYAKDLEAHLTHLRQIYELENERKSAVSERRKAQTNPPTKAETQAQTSAQTPAKPLNATEQVLARYGAKEFTELHAKKPTPNPRNFSIPPR